MGWWEAITTHGRLLGTAVVRWDGSALRVQVFGLRPGERPAVVLDHWKKRAYFLCELNVGQYLLKLHNYDGVVSDKTT